MVGAIDSALSGLLAQGTRVSAAADNIANAHSPDHKAVDVVLSSEAINGEGAGVSARITERPAERQGVSLDEEIITLKQAELAYKANIATIKVAEELQDELLSAFDEEA